MQARVLAVSLLGVLPLHGHAQDAFGSRYESAIAGAMSYLRSDKPRRSLDPHDNLNLWQQSLGVGAQLDVAKNWTLRIDVDRYQPKFPGANVRESTDTAVTLYFSFPSL